MGARDLESEAIRRRLRARLFEETHAEVKIGRFSVRALLGRGGMGEVYAATDSQLGREVAIKVIRADRLLAAAGERSRLLREAQTQARLSHPNVVPIYEVGEHEGGIFVVMEQIRGPTLRQWLRDAPRSRGEILRLFVEAARGLGAAHRIGIVHRDFKPENALVDEEGRVRLTDFGLARASSPDETAATTSERDPAEGTTSRHAGTPAYMSPEQTLGGQCDPRSDQFSFCMALAEALFGRLPPPAHQRVARDDGLKPYFAGPATVGASRWLRRVLARGLSLAPTERFASMDELISALVDRPRRRRLWSLGAGMVAALLAAAALGARVREVAPLPCADIAAARSTLWDESRSATLRDVFTASALPFADASWERTGLALDEYAGRWAEAQRANCEDSAARAQPAQQHARRERCLGDARAAWDALLAALIAADAALVADAADLVAALPAPEACSEEDGAGATRPASPDDQAFDQGLEQAKILLRTELGRVAQASLQELLTKAVDPGRLAEALLSLGEVRTRLLDDPVGAKEALDAAYDRATVARRPDLVWKIWTLQALRSALLLEAPAEARAALEHARHAAPEAARAELLAVEGEILRVEGRFTDALAVRRAALQAFAAALPPAHPEVIRARLAVAVALAEDDQQPEARRLHEEILADLQRRYGTEHPWPARAEVNLGLDLFELDELADARRHLQHARGSLAAAYGATHPSVASADVALAQIDREEQDLAGAIARAEAALKAYEASLPPAHSKRITALLVLAELYRERRDFAALLAVSSELLERSEGPSGREIDLPTVLFNVGECMCELGRCPESLVYFARVKEIYDREPPEEQGFRASPLRGLGLAHAAKGEHALAVPLFEEALRTYGSIAPQSQAMFRPVIAATSRSLAASLTALRRAPARARALLRQAEALEREQAASGPQQ